MTFVVKMRGAPGLVLAEYECPVHGRFEATEKGPPDEVPCPGVGCGVCSDCELGDVCGEERGPCGMPSPWVISAVHGKVKIAEVQRGKSDERPPWALNTEALADGMPMHEWRAKQDKLDRDRRVKKNREALK